MIDVQQNRDNINEALQLVEVTDGRSVKKLCDFLKESDFYVAPAAAYNHLAVEGGLAQHSLNVMNAMNAISQSNKIDTIPMPSIIIAGLLHDLCKIGTYVKKFDDATSAQMNYVKSFKGWNEVRSEMIEAGHKKFSKQFISDMIGHFKENKPMPSFDSNGESYVIEDQLPIGHGEKSLYLASRMFDLTDDEAMAIRWHMGAFEPGINFLYPTGYAYKAASEKTPLMHLLILADYYATWFMEGVFTK